MDKGVWKPSAIAGAAKPLFAGVPSLLVDPTPRLAPGCCASIPCPPFSRPGSSVVLQEAWTFTRSIMLFFDRTLLFLQISNKDYGFIF